MRQTKWRTGMCMAGLLLAALVLWWAGPRLGAAEAGSGAEAERDAAEFAGNDRPKIAVLATYFGRHSHGHALATKFFTGYPTDDGLIEPKVEVVSFWADQPAEDDIAVQLAEAAGIEVYPTITEALTLGGDDLAVDGVIYIGLHGDYPRSRLNIRMYPKLRHLAEVFEVFEWSGRSVPVFCDKELNYHWLDAKWIYDRAAELDVPMMAGSTLPVAWRDPPLEHEPGARITEAVSIGYGPLNSYLLHMVEINQSMIEHRAGGETGVESVRCLRGEAVYEAAEAGAFSMELVEAAAATIDAKRDGTMRDNDPNPLAIIVTYRDGTTATAISSSRYIGEHFAYAAVVDGETVATEFILPKNRVFAHFSYLWLNVEQMFVTGEPRWPVERNLIANGIIDAAMRSLDQDGRLIETPHLDISYAAPDPRPIHPPNPRPTGQSVGPWPPEGWEFIGWER